MELSSSFPWIPTSDMPFAEHLALGRESWDVRIQTPSLHLNQHTTEITIFLNKVSNLQTVGWVWAAFFTSVVLFHFVQTHTNVQCSIKHYGTTRWPFCRKESRLETVLQCTACSTHLWHELIWSPNPTEQLPQKRLTCGVSPGSVPSSTLCHSSYKQKSQLYSFFWVPSEHP